MVFYAVHKGRQSGVFMTWDECKKRIHNYEGPVYKKFETFEEANEFVLNGRKEKKIVKKEEKKEIPIIEDIIVYTDGAAKNNGKINCVAGYGAYFPNHSSFNISKKLTSGPNFERVSNQRAELMACVAALELIKEKEMKGSILIRTDSMYTINCVTKWIPAWIKNNWMTKNKEPVKNKDLIERLFKLSDNVRYEHVKGHSNNKGNDIADRLAVAGSQLN